MSLDETGYLHIITSERTKLHDAIIPPTVKVTSKPQDKKLCTNCHRAMMEPYLQPNSRFIDENGYDNAGFKANSWYWKCTLIECNYKELMPTQQENTKKGYHTKNTVVSRLPMWLGEPGNPTNNRKPRRPKGLQEVTDKDDVQQLTDYFGYTPASISYHES